MSKHTVFRSSRMDSRDKSQSFQFTVGPSRECIPKTPSEVMVRVSSTTILTTLRTEERPTIGPRYEIRINSNDRKEEFTGGR